MENLNSSEKQVAQLEQEDYSVDESQVTAITPIEAFEEVGHEEQRRSRPRKNWLPKLAIGALLTAGTIAAGVYTYRWWEYNKYHVTTDNAYTSADIYPVSSRVGGVVSEVLAKDNQAANPGMVLVKLDPRESQVTLTQAKAALDVAKQQAEVAKQNIDNVPSIPEPVASVPGNPPGQLRPSVINLQPNNSRQVEVNRQQYKATLAAIPQKEAEVKEAELKLSYANVTALVPGKISNSNIRVGQPIQPGQTLLEIIQPNPWIVANFREEQLEKIRPGQKAQIKIAAFPSRKFIGTVESVSPTSTNRFISPSPDSTPNNYSNVAPNNVHRISAKIVLEPESIKDFESQIAPGMSADVTITTKSK
jgi:membrane fusion protein, multidrug efflux system